MIEIRVWREASHLPSYDRPCVIDQTEFLDVAQSRATALRSRGGHAFNPATGLTFFPYFGWFRNENHRAAFNGMEDEIV